jgi:hypothetical protein
VDLPWRAPSPAKVLIHLDASLTGFVDAQVGFVCGA